MPYHRPVVTSHPSQPLPETATSVLAFASLVGERLTVGTRWLASRLLLVSGVLGTHAVRATRSGAPAVLGGLRRTPAWVVHCLVILAGVWLVGMSGLIVLRATLGPETGAGLLSATFPAFAAMLLAAAAVLLGIHRTATSGRDMSPALALAGAVAALALG